jgi:hypothetical protein
MPDAVARRACRKRVVDIHHEARLQAIIDYHGIKLGQKVTKKEARLMTLTKPQFIEVAKEC